jgi:3-phenylpropionate/cinnamic acid dioxygenase small subunit
VDLQLIADRLAIVDVLHRYATGLDSRAWDLLASAFTEDGVADYGELGGVNRGPEAIVALCRGALQGLDASQHIIANEVIEVDGDTARARCYFQAQHVCVGTEGGDTYMVGGTYEDELVRTPEGWRIRHRTLVPSWTEGNPGVFEAGAARLADASRRS